MAELACITRNPFSPVENTKVHSLRSPKDNYSNSCFKPHNFIALFGNMVVWVGIEIFLVNILLWILFTMIISVEIFIISLLLRALQTNHYSTVRVCLYIYIYIYTHIHCRSYSIEHILYIYMWIRISMYTNICVCVCVCVCMRICMLTLVN